MLGSNLGLAGSCGMNDESALYTSDEPHSTADENRDPDFVSTSPFDEAPPVVQAALNPRCVRRYRTNPKAEKPSRNTSPAAHINVLASTRNQEGGPSSLLAWAPRRM